jgi:hypothetical protein
MIAAHRALDNLAKHLVINVMVGDRRRAVPPNQSVSLLSSFTLAEITSAVVVLRHA